MTRRLALIPPTVLAASCVALFASVATADEGMWPFNMIPKAKISSTHKVELSDDWLGHVQRSSVRFNNGGSGSFVSSNGLVLSNHHVASNCIAKITTPEHDYLNDGYLAATPADEIKCPDLELNQLVATSDVTERVIAARQGAADDAAANTAVKAAMSAIESECTEKTGLRCDVVTLYAGGKYNLYTYKKYTDVRLVFAPEGTMAFFGGDPDNFTFPRYDLDMTLVRVYGSDGKPLTPTDYLTWNARGAQENEVVFVSGHPGSTGRMDTMAQLEFLRDVGYPAVLARLAAERKELIAFAKTGTEAARQTRSPLFGIDNSIKALTGFQKGLKDKSLMAKRGHDESSLRASIAANAELRDKYEHLFDNIAKAQAANKRIHARYVALEGGARGQLFHIARDLVRLPRELAVDNSKRLREYRASALESLYFSLDSSAPIYGGVEVAALKTWLTQLQTKLGKNDPLVKKVLAGKTPEARARELVAGTRISDVFARKTLRAAGAEAIAQSTDQMIALQRTLDDEARAIRKQYEDEVEGPMRDYGEKIAKAVFAAYGSNVAPDATFTLRLSIGKATGYTEGKKAIPWATNFGGMYRHATGTEPYKLTPRWLAAKDKLTLDTPFNFVSTNDIIGGNSGSPVVNAKGEIVGLIFDGNLSSLPNRFVYDEQTARAVSVHTAGMTEALLKVYGATAIVDELTGSTKP